jgi:hypothetical protein
LWTEADDERHAAEVVAVGSHPPPWIAGDLRIRDVLLGAALHLWAQLLARLRRQPPPVWGLADQNAYSQFCRQLKEPVSELGPDATEMERWLAEDLDPFEGIDKFYSA